MLEQAVYNTIRYFDLLDLPLTAVQTWQYLIVDSHEGGLRWQGHARYTLADVRSTLQHSKWLAARVDSQWGYFFLRGRGRLVRQRLYRHNLAQDKWKIARRCARWLAAMPFIRGLAGSGSLALDNTSPGSDLDFLVIAAPKRIWTARLELLFISQLLGRRRKYWNEKAPDKLCLNHYLTADSLMIDASIHNLYTAVMYSVIVPVYDRRQINEFLATNDVWIRQYVMEASLPDAGHAYTVRLPRVIATIKKHLELFLLEFVGDGLEILARRIQTALIRRHYRFGQPGRVVTNDCELAFHPDTKMPLILGRYGRDPGQQQLI